jgi:hypothetical protein
MTAHAPLRLLRSDCSRCVGLCCVALPFGASADFAFDKAAGEPCRHLGPDFGCGVHDRLRGLGFKGCTVFECFGAGQRVSQETFAEADWRADRALAQRVFAAFTVMRQLHQLLWYLREAQALPALDDELRRAVREVEERTERLASGNPDGLAALDVGAHRREVHDVLARASTAARSVAPQRQARRTPSGRLRPGADLMGADLRRHDLRGLDLTGAYLIAADLRGVDLHLTDLMGADLRDADLRGADLTRALFLTQPQVNAANGDRTTRLPSSLGRPSHWP